MIIETFQLKNERTSFYIKELKTKLVVPNDMIVNKGTTHNTFFHLLDTIKDELKHNPDTLNKGTGGVVIEGHPKFNN